MSQVALGSELGISVKSYDLSISERKARSTSRTLSRSVTRGIQKLQKLDPAPPGQELARETMIADVYAGRNDRRFILVRFVRGPHGLSVTDGQFLAFQWDQFRTEGLASVSQAIAEYSTTRKAAPSQFDRMSGQERTSFLAKHVEY